MAKPKKTKGKKGGDSGKNDEQKDKILEVDKEWFQIQIKSLEEKLDRRNERMRHLETSNKEFQERFEQLREDKADVVAFLKRTLQQRTDQICELQARLEGLQHVHATDARQYEARLTDFEQEFAKTKEALASENMVLTKKLDALEEFRIQREQLMAKFEEQESSAERQRQTYEERIYELEKKHIKEQDRLKRDTMTKLESVAAEFRKAARAQMAATTQRTLRENVNVTAQVMQLSDKSCELAEENDRLLDKNKEQRRRIELLDAEQSELVKRNAHRLKVIEELVARCNTQEQTIKDLNSFYSERRKYEMTIATLQGQIEEMESRLGASTATTKEKEVAISDINQRLRGIAKTKDVINMCLNEASFSIRAALSLEVTSEEHDTKARREDVLNQLLVLLNTAVAESKQLRITDDGDVKTRPTSAVTQDRGRPTSAVTSDRGRPTSAATSDRGRLEREDSIEYQHGQLGLVPMSK